MAVNEMKNISGDICDRSQPRVQAAGPSETKNFLVAHNGIKNYRCNICDLVFSTKSDLTEHNIIHTGKKSYKCEKAFSQKGHLTEHMVTHSGINNFKCHICDKAFGLKRSLAYHITTHSEIREFKCSICDRAFHHKHNLTQHMVTHSAIKNFKCHICGRPFKHRSSLFYHIRTHSAIKKFKCGMCEKAFHLKSNLTKHMVTHTHTGIKNFNCKICEMSFSANRDLTKHKLFHLRRKEFERDISEKVHRSEEDLTIHTGIENFKCSNCKEAFCTESELNGHHAAKESVEYSICHRIFAHSGYLSKHKFLGVAPKASTPKGETSGLAGSPSQYTIVYIRSDVSTENHLAEHSPSFCMDKIKEEEDGETRVKVEPGSNDLFETKDHFEELGSGAAAFVPYVKIEGQEGLLDTGCVKIEGQEEVVDTGCVKIEGEEGVTNVKKGEEEELQFEKMNSNFCDGLLVPNSEFSSLH